MDLSTLIRITFEDGVELKQTAPLRFDLSSLPDAPQQEFDFYESDGEESNNEHAYDKIMTDNMKPNNDKASEESTLSNEDCKILISF